MTPQPADPEHIAVSRTRGIMIDWKDGHHSQYSLRYLRDRCPCASCTGAHGGTPEKGAASSPFEMYKPALKIESVEAAGSYAISIAWNDGHRTGIYTYDYLRSICPCPECTAPEQENSGPRQE
ncbi:MAG: DUF971 domain-containing protein [Bryobacterales bacterium]|nr:DUF971 domain-containing protein [Bryobacterales bacterium]